MPDKSVPRVDILQGEAANTFVRSRLVAASN